MSKKANRKPNKKQIPVRISSWQRCLTIFRKWRITIYSVIGFFSIVLGLLQGPQTYDYLKDKFFTSKHGKFHSQYYTEGEIKSPEFKPSIFQNNHKIPYEISTDAPNFKIPTNYLKYPVINGIPIGDLKKRPYLFVFVSGYLFTCFPEGLYRGIDIFNPIFNSCFASRLTLGVKDNKLYISTQLKDLNDNFMASIKFNHWEIYNPNVLEFYDNDPEKLEIRDKQNNIVLSVSYELNTVFIGGYFMGDKSVIVFPNDPKRSKSINPFCMLKADSNWKQKALEEIRVIKSVYR